MIPYLPCSRMQSKILEKEAPPGKVQEVISHLCGIRSYTADELAEILNRNKKWVKRSYLIPMLRDGILEYAIPESPQHPKQAYHTKKKYDESVIPEMNK